MEVTAYWEGGYRCRVPLRDFEVVSDEPPHAGGNDDGPAPTELFLSSLAVCFAMAMYHAARKREVELPDLAVKVRGTYEGLKFVRLHVEVSSSHPRAELEALLERASSYCYVSNTLRHGPDLSYSVADVTGARAPEQA
jgi:uncharacterized OsmC-like protein